MAWIENGPVSVPSRPIVMMVAVAAVVAALAAAGFGLRTGWRDGGSSDIGATDQIPGLDHAVIAKPIVEIPSQIQQAAAANVATASNTAEAKADETADSNDIAAKTAEAQAVQSQPSQSSADIDDILASPSEKPQAPAKSSPAETPPGVPAKSDVPF